MTTLNAAVAPTVSRPRPTIVYISGTLLVLLVASAVLAPWLAPHDPYVQDLLASLQSPSNQHWLGTDEQGRDVLSRLLYALRIDFYAAFVSVGIGLIIGVPFGLLLGYSGYWLDWIGMRLVDAALAIPPIVLVLVVVAVLGRGLTNAMIALGFLFALPFLRLVRGEMLTLRGSLYARAARATGLSRLTIVTRHLMPALLPAVIIQIGLMLPVAFLVEATLSYLGLSAQPPEASLGIMLRSAQTVALTQPWQVLPAGVVLVLITLTLNLVADGISETLNPRPSAAHLLATAAGPLPPRKKTAEEAPLRIENLSLALRTGAVTPPIAVRDISLAVAPGEIVAIVGESGSGKTLTAMSILGTLPGAVYVAGGSVQVGGVEVVGARPAVLRRLRAYDVGVIFQDPLANLDPSQTVGHQLIAPLIRRHGMDRQLARRRVVQVLEEVGVQEPELRLRQYPHELSGGLAQRIMIALALSREPQLLIADEPTSALDVTVQVQVLDLLRRLRAERNLSVLLITHDMGVVRHVADRVLVMYAGVVVEEGPVSLLDSPQHPYTAALLAAVPRNTAVRQPLPIVLGRVPAPGEHSLGCAFAPRCSRTDDICRQPLPVMEIGARKLRCVHPLSS